jgi:ATP phosphoribosyltransferase
MGMADVIVDLVSSGTTLRENNLKEINGGVILESQVSSHTQRHGLAKFQVLFHLLKVKSRDHFISSPTLHRPHL